MTGEYRVSDNSLSKILFWDGKADRFGVYISKIEAYALDPVLMANCPAWTEYATIGITKPDNQNLIDLYKVNKKLCVIIELGQGKSHRMALPSKTKSDDNPNRLDWEFVNKAKKANKPSDAVL